MSEFIRDWVYPVVVTLMVTGILAAIAVGMMALAILLMEVMIG